jgi:hypothetical protein
VDADPHACLARPAHIDARITDAGTAFSQPDT